ncbi:MAG: outer membrane lipid asymmetry maintenance protein MlaD [Candidatus Sumerlaeota bacterium]|nr:outer membrane lipid asymmetry maintenance protein MlaD [Candidatus Sumerlaeota bacterium]
MKSSSVEISVGVFVMIGLACVVYLTVKLGKLEVIGGDYYRINARFNSVSGLKTGAIVDVAGVQIGVVERIKLDTNEMVALVRMKIRKDIPVDKEAIAAVKTSGLIGDKYIKIEPGGSKVFLKDGGQITQTQSSVDLEALISKYAFGGV